MATRKEQAYATKTRIVRATLQLLTRIRYQDLKVADICRASGVSVGTFYHYFPTKDAVLLEGGLPFDRWLEKQLNSKKIFKNVSDKLEYFSEMYFFNMFSVGLNGVAATFVYQLNDERGDFHSQNRYLYTKLSEILEEGFSSGEFQSDYTPKEIKQAIISMYRGVTFDWCIENGSFDIISVGKLTTKMLLDGMLKNRASSL